MSKVVVTIIPVVNGAESKTVSACLSVDESNVKVDIGGRFTSIDVELGTEEIDLLDGVIERARQPLEGDTSTYRWWSISVAFKQKTLISDYAHVSLPKREDNARFLMIYGENINFGQRVHCGCEICKKCGKPI